MRESGCVGVGVREWVSGRGRACEWVWACVLFCHVLSTATGCKCRHPVNTLERTFLPACIYIYNIHARCCHTIRHRRQLFSATSTKAPGTERWTLYEWQKALGEGGIAGATSARHRPPREHLGRVMNERCTGFDEPC